MELILITQLFYCSQQVVDDGLELRALQALQHKGTVTQEWFLASLKESRLAASRHPPGPLAGQGA